MEINFCSPLLGEDHILKLNRYPENKDPNLRAWDAADELILSDLSSRELNNKRILILNDSFGALTCSLTDYDTTSYTDSFVSYKAIQDNIKANDKEEVKLLNDITLLGAQKFDLIILKLPKNLSFLEDTLSYINPLMNENSKLICAGMIKHMAKSSFELIQEYIGETSTSLAKKKARLIFAKKEFDRIESPYPNKLKIEGLDHEFINHSNLFSREKLDIGTRFFIENIPNNCSGKILDIGCANGILGIKAKLNNPLAKIIFADESYMAIKSAKENFKNYFPDDEAIFKWTNCYENEEKDLDLVLCNPPFHQGNTIGDFIAWQMFTDSMNSLNKGGLIRVIGNRHLAYHVKLKKIFKNSKVINQNKKFVIIDSYKY